MGVLTSVGHIFPRSVKKDTWVEYSQKQDISNDDISGILSFDEGDM